ncbi:NAD(P)-binding domain-containing protein [Mycolicibacterium iranicum]|uniref:NAD(P)-binding domain-containing protein n=1 Tax=Mycolicibacterium iranicum TaxID=912594 RepID=UPI001F1F02C2|nr:NAD(P)-binding domain-containing protein [Mycolicibacterium iranicum]
MNFGTIGAGTIAQALARHLVTAGHRVMLSNSRGPSTLGGRCQSGPADLGRHGGASREG